MKWKKLSFSKKAAVVGMLYGLLFAFIFILFDIGIPFPGLWFTYVIIIFFAPISLPTLFFGILLSGMHGSFGVEGWTVIAVFVAILGLIEGYIVGRLILLFRFIIKRIKRKK
ncbi:MAG TPA: hypothetical protein VJH37_04870 [Candidatus Nanoarchaeia archaeon]|nr:hypothetical protein [Candidatus Nanoarchaeia archaeon]